jgi:hypothetical protein
MVCTLHEVPYHDLPLVQWWMNAFCPTLLVMKQTSKRWHYMETRKDQFKKFKSTEDDGWKYRHWMMRNGWHVRTWMMWNGCHISLCDYFSTLCNISGMMNSSLSKSINGQWVSRTLTTMNKLALARELHLTHCTYSMFALKTGDEALDRVG